MLAFRLVKAKHAATALDGEGARRVGGRWNEVGVPVAYCASHLSLAVLELLVHVDPALAPDDLMAVTIEIPDTLKIQRLTPATLPKDWRKDSGKAALRILGGKWIADKIESVLLVPSVIVPDESNVLINPAHPDATMIKIVATRPFVFDPRLL